MNFGKMWSNGYLLIFVFLVTLCNYVNCLGCMKSICGGNVNSNVRPCQSDGTDCGHFEGKRRDSQILKAVDLLCELEEAIYAPFDGELSYHQPFGGEPDFQCADQGIRIDGSGQWRGYYVLISTVVPFKFGGQVVAGDKIAVAGNLDCPLDRSKQSARNYIRVELFRNGKEVDITQHLVDCMCTGQICETNYNNRLIGQPFRVESKYNSVRGWEVYCPLREEDDEQSDENVYEDDPLAPLVYSPIEGEILGRVRLNYKGNIYAGCENDAIFITGTGTWLDYEVRIYNVRYREDLGFGRKHVVQGQPVARRLNCPSSPDSVFIEVRFQGVIVDITDAIKAENCRHKSFSGLF